MTNKDPPISPHFQAMIEKMKTTSLGLEPIKEESSYVVSDPAVQRLLDRGADNNDLWMGTFLIGAAKAAKRDRAAFTALPKDEQFRLVVENGYLGEAPKDGSAPLLDPARNDRAFRLLFDLVIDDINFGPPYRDTFERHGRRLTWAEYDALPSEPYDPAAP